jgi:hypothetical protein
MDKSTSPNTPEKKHPTSFQFGMSSYNSADREQFGQSVRLAMACMQSEPQQFNGNALPHDESSIRQRLKMLSQEMTSQHADLLELLVRFDKQQAWKSSGASHCAAWMNAEIGISTQLSWEYLRVGRQLQSLPTLLALFRVGKLSWSKVRLITRVANDDNEKTLCHAALDASVSEVKRLCEAYRWSNDDAKDGHAENTRAMQQWDSRSLTWREASNGSTQIQLVLPPELAQAFLNSIEHSLSESGTSNKTMSQRRADAAVMMAESSLQSAGKAIATADRYQVSVSIDESELVNDCASASMTDSSITSNKPINPAKRPTIHNAGPIARETARRIACDCSLAVNKTSNGEPTDIGRKSRIWPHAMARAIKERDQQCVWPGCDHSRHLHIHHIEHWADGGATSVENGVCLCSYHHTLVHEGGYRIERVAHNKDGMHMQFFQQLNLHDIHQFEFEESLRNDVDSFNTVRQLSPTRFRFRIMDKNGNDIVNASIAKNNPVQKVVDDSTCVDSTRADSTQIDSNITSDKGVTEFTSDILDDSRRVKYDSPHIESKRDSKRDSIRWQFKEPAPAAYCT